MVIADGVEGPGEELYLQRTIDLRGTQHGTLWTWLERFHIDLFFNFLLCTLSSRYESRRKSTLNSHVPIMQLQVLSTHC